MSLLLLLVMVTVSSAVLSVLSSGTEDNHLEMRVRVTVDMVLHEDRYTNKTYLQKSSDSTEDVLPFVVLFSDVPFDGAVPRDPIRLQSLYRSEILNVRRRGSYSGVWQMFSAANALGCNVQSIYPDLGEEPVRRVMNTTFYPSSGVAAKTEAIMWTSHRTDMPAAFWVANHVVPLLPVQSPPGDDELRYVYCTE